MAQLIINQKGGEAQDRVRLQAFLALTPEQRIMRLFQLMEFAQWMKKGEPLKRPQGKGLVIEKRHCSRVLDDDTVNS